MISIMREKKPKAKPKPKPKPKRKPVARQTVTSSTSGTSNNKQTVHITINNPSANADQKAQMDISGASAKQSMDAAGEQLKTTYKQFNDLLARAEALKIIVPDAIKKITIVEGDINTVEKINNLILELKARSAKAFKSFLVS